MRIHPKIKSKLSKVHPSIAPLKGLNTAEIPQHKRNMYSYLIVGSRYYPGRNYLENHQISGGKQI